MAAKDLKKVMSQYMSDARVKEAVAEAKSKDVPLYELWGDSIKLAQQIYEGRNVSELTPSEFWSPLDMNSKLLGIDIISSDQECNTDIKAFAPSIYTVKYPTQIEEVYLKKHQQ